MLDTTTHTWTAAYKYYTRLSTESQAAFEAIQFDNQDTDLFSWLNSQLSTHNNLLDNPVQFNQWFEHTYDFQNIVSSVREVAPPATVEEFIELLEEVVVPEVVIESTPVVTIYGTSLMDSLRNVRELSSTDDDAWIMATYFGIVDYDVNNITLPSGRTISSKTYYRRVAKIKASV
jgi:hypothetical protein